MQRLGTLLFLSAMLALPLLLASLIPGWGADAWAAGTAGGAEELFQAQRCDLCHGIEKLGIPARQTPATVAGPDLSQVGATRDAGSITGYLREREAGGEEHGAWQGSPQELEELSAWLATLE